MVEGSRTGWGVGVVERERSRLEAEADVVVVDVDDNNGGSVGSSASASCCVRTTDAGVLLSAAILADPVVLRSKLEVEVEGESRQRRQPGATGRTGTWDLGLAGPTAAERC